MLETGKDIYIPEKRERSHSAGGMGNGTITLETNFLKVKHTPTVWS